MAFVSYIFIIFGLVVHKPKKTGVMNTAHLIALCRMYSCCAWSVLPLSPLILTHGSRWSCSAFVLHGALHRSQEGAILLLPRLWSLMFALILILSNPRVGRLGKKKRAIFFHVMGCVSEFVLFLNRQVSSSFLHCKVSVLLLDDK